MTRPLLPRASSATSAFFFCGISDDPVAWLSGRLANPNSALDQSTSSSPRREQWTMVSAQAAVISTAKSRSATASMLLAAMRPKPSSWATRSRSSGSVEPASAPLPRGSSSQATTRRAEAERVAREHLDVGEQVMRERHHLRALQMGVAGHRRGAMLGRARHQRLLQPASATSRSVHARRAHMRRSVATWSLRLRPVCSMPATGPASSKSRRSTAV